VITRPIAPGERALVMILAVDKDQAGVIFGYLKALIQQTPMLAGGRLGASRAEIVCSDPQGKEYSPYLTGVAGCPVE
jgi:hypothetical protein